MGDWVVVVGAGGRCEMWEIRDAEVLSSAVTMRVLVQAECRQRVDGGGRWMSSGHEVNGPIRMADDGRQTRNGSGGNSVSTITRTTAKHKTMNGDGVAVTGSTDVLGASPSLGMNTSAPMAAEGSVHGGAPCWAPLLLRNHTDAVSPR